jgi:hypothetical protein
MPLRLSASLSASLCLSLCLSLSASLSLPLSLCLSLSLPLSLCLSLSASLGHSAAALILVAGGDVLLFEFVHALPVVIQLTMSRSHHKRSLPVPSFRSTILIKLAVNEAAVVDPVRDKGPVLVASAVCHELHEKLLGLALPHAPRVFVELVNPFWHCTSVQSKR